MSECGATKCRGASGRCSCGLLRLRALIIAEAIEDSMDDAEE